MKEPTIFHFAIIFIACNSNGYKTFVVNSKCENEFHRFGDGDDDGGDKEQRNINIQHPPNAQCEGN